MSVIIKANDTRVTSRGLYGMELRDIARQADGMLAAARAQAEAIIEDGRRRAAAEHEKARRAGYDAGLAQGLAEGRESGEKAALEAGERKFSEDHAALLASLSGLLAEFDRRREQFLAAARRDVVVLAVAIASRLVRRFAGMEDVAAQIAADACGEAMALVGASTDVVVMMSPADAAVVEQLGGATGRALKSSIHVKLIEDASMPRGDVRVATADTRVDAAVNERIARIADELVQDWRRRSADLGIEP